MQRDAVDPLAYYDLERYLFEQVSPRFYDRGYINAFDFFSIVIWKANRAKSVTARRLLAIGKTHGLLQLDDICASISHGLYESESDEARFQLLVCEWKFLLPMASAVLTVLNPERFTVYDYRVCGQLENLGFSGFRNLANRVNPRTLWPGYQQFISAVQQATQGTHGACSLRDMDRYLTGRSMSHDLQDEIASAFGNIQPANSPGGTG